MSSTTFAVPFSVIQSETLIYVSTMKASFTRWIPTVDLSFPAARDKYCLMNDNQGTNYFLQAPGSSVFGNRKTLYCNTAFIPACTVFDYNILNCKKRIKVRIQVCQTKTFIATSSSFTINLTKFHLFTTLSSVTSLVTYLTTTLEILSTLTAIYTFTNMMKTDFVFDGTFFLQNTSPSGLPVGNTSRSMFGWVKPASGVSTTIGLMGWGTPNIEYERDHNVLLYDRNNTGDLGFWSNYGDFDPADDNNVLTPDVWNFVGMTWDGTTLSLYLNNYSWSNSLVDLNTAEGNVRVGLGDDWNAVRSSLFKGDMADIGVWSRVLTDGEISTLLTGPLAYYELPDGLRRETFVDLDTQHQSTSELDIRTRHLSGLLTSSDSPIYCVEETILETTTGDLDTANNGPLYSSAPETVLDTLSDKITALYTSSDSIFETAIITRDVLRTSNGDILQIGDIDNARLVSFWNLSEISGSRYDSVSSNHLNYVVAIASFTTNSVVVVSVETSFTDTSAVASSWYWDFGNGDTSTEQNPTETFVAAGVYTITLIVDGDNATADSREITAGYSSSMSFVSINGVETSVSFTDTTSGSPASWLWSFGDGGTSTDQNPTHTYSDVGNYTVTLTTDGIYALQTSSSIQIISVSFSVASTAGVGNSVPFTNTSGNTSSWAWNFGDDSGTSTAENPSYAYSAPGTYTVTLVADAIEALAVTNSITILAAPIQSATFAAVANGQTEIDLSWSDMPEGDEADLYWSYNESDSWTQILTNSSDTTYVHTGLNPGTNYYYLLAYYSPAANLQGPYAETGATTTSSSYVWDELNIATNCNIVGIVNDETVYYLDPGFGVDGHPPGVSGNCLSSAQVGTSQTWNRVNFSILPFVSPINEVQQFSFSPTPTDGYFTITVTVESTPYTTPYIPYTCSASDVSSYINTAVNSSWNTVDVSGDISSGFTVTYDQTNTSGRPIPLLTINTTGLAEVQQITMPGGQIQGTWSLQGQTLNWNAAVSDVQSALDTALGVDVVVVSGSDGGPYTVTWDSSGPQSLLTAGNIDLAAQAGAYINELVTGDVNTQERQQLIFTGSPNEGTFVLEGNTLPWNASGEQIVEDLFGIGINQYGYGGGILVLTWGTNGYHSLLTIDGSGLLSVLGNPNVNEITAGLDSLTGSGDAASIASVSETTLGVVATPNIIYANGQTIPLGGGQYDYLEILGMATDGNVASQSFTVNYADGSSDTVVQSFSDWYTPQGYPNESTVLTMSYRDRSDGGNDPGSPNIYGYTWSIDRTKAAVSLTFPNSTDGGPYIMFIAITQVAQVSGLTLWVKADSLAINDSYVANFNDLSGNNNNLIQTNPSLQPLYVPNVVNGLPVLRFDGTGTALQGAVAASDSAYSAFVVMKENVSSQFGVALSWGSTGLGAYWTGYIVNSEHPEDGHLVVASDSTNDIWAHDVYQDQNWHITEGIHSSGSMNGYDTGIYITTAESADRSGNTVTLGGYTASANLPFNGDIAEVILFGATLSDSDRVVIESYLASKYGIVYYDFLYDADYLGGLDGSSVMGWQAAKGSNFTFSPTEPVVRINLINGHNAIEGSTSTNTASATVSNWPGDFTIFGYIKINDFGNGNAVPFTVRSNSYLYPMIICESGSGSISARMLTTGGDVTIQSGIVNAGDWQFVCVERTENNFYLYIGDMNTPAASGSISGTVTVNALYLFSSDAFDVCGADIARISAVSFAMTQAQRDAEKAIYQYKYGF